MIGVVIPALNESPTVGAVVDRTLTTIPHAAVVVVDDASSDETAAIARAAGATVVRHAASVGYAEALRAGYRVLLEMGAQRVLQLDADGQHTPEDLPRLLRALDDYDIVIGSRFMGAGYRMSHARRIGIEACRVMARACGVAVTDPTSGIRAVRLDVARAVVDAGFPDGLTESSFLVWLRRRGHSIGEVPVTMRAATNGSMHDGVAGVTHFLRIVRSTVSVAVRRDSR